MSTSIIRRVDYLRDDLKMELQVLNPSRGAIVIVRPKNTEFTVMPSYMEWVKEVLHELRPDIKIIILSENNISIEEKDPLK